MKHLSDNDTTFGPAQIGTAVPWTTYTRGEQALFFPQSASATPLFGTGIFAMHYSFILADLAVRWRYSAIFTVQSCTMFMTHGHAARTSGWTCNMNMQPGHVVWSCSIIKQAAWTAAQTCSMDMQHGQGMWTWSSMVLQHKNMDTGRAAWTCSKGMHIQAAWTFSMDTRVSIFRQKNYLRVIW